MVKPRPLTLPCTRYDIHGAVSGLWPKVAADRGVDWCEHAPIVDGHMGVGFSIRLFGPPRPDPAEARLAYAALEDLLRALENKGFEVTRDGNEWQPGRLVLGWSAFQRANGTELVRFCDEVDTHEAKMERRERLRREHAAADEGARRPVEGN